MSVVEIPQDPRSCVSRISVQVSEYSAANGGMDKGTIYAVEVLYPDGTWTIASHHRDLTEARVEADAEASRRGALLLTQSMWPSRQISA